MKKLGFGTMRLPVIDGDTAKIDLEKFSQMVDLFLERGFTYFDTSYVYHGGMSESALKTALVDRYPRDRFTITTKLPVFLLQSDSDTRKYFTEQLGRLGTGYVDYYWLHALNAATYAQAEKFHAFEEMQKLKDEGKIRHLGFSFHDSAQVLDRILTAHPEMEYVQLQLNYFDWDSNSVQAKACYETVVRHGKQVVVMEPVKGGSLVQVPAEVEQMFRQKQPDLSNASWAIRFAASLDHVLVVLSGMSNLEQVEDNTSYMENFVPLDQEEQEIVQKAAAVIRSQREVDCISCGKCTEVCPKNIPMADYFDMYNEFCQMHHYTNGMVYYGAFPAGTGKASACIGCGKCEDVCPKKLPIQDLLKKVSAAFETTAL
jgi:predicted aldo/keto reductase-like oxidoreductase